MSATNLEERLSEFAGYLEETRHAEWSACDVVRAAIMEHSGGPKKGRRAVAAAIAQTGMMTARRALRMAELAEAFPTDLRYPDVDIAVYREALAAAKRARVSPVDVLNEALENGWHVREIAAHYPARRQKAVEIRGTCEECGAETVLRKAAPGTRLLCAQCVDQAIQDGDLPMPQRVPILGVVREGAAV